MLLTPISTEIRMQESAQMISLVVYTLNVYVSVIHSTYQLLAASGRDQDNILSSSTAPARMGDNFS